MSGRNVLKHASSMCDSGKNISCCHGRVQTETYFIDHFGAPGDCVLICVCAFSPQYRDQPETAGDHEADGLS